MNTLTVRILPRSAFGTPLMGDTLFGQLCWAIRNRYGESRLEELLDGYTRGRPFAVVSDAFPAGFLPQPSLPIHWFKEPPGEDRKTIKKRRWLPREALTHPLEQWLTHCRSDIEVAGGKEMVQVHPQPHNTIDRCTGTTGEGGFAPYTMRQEWYAESVFLECHIVHDQERFSEDELTGCLSDIGAIGFGRDASIGLGKFIVEEKSAANLIGQANPNAALTLAPCAPQGLGFNPERSFYPIFTRFGRHGDLGVHLTGQPFKNPVLLAGTGAIFAPLPGNAAFIGQGLGGDGALSKAIPETVQQGYSPIIPIHLPENREQAA